VGYSVEIRQEDPVAVLFSSGTTGESKGVVLTHRNMMAVCGVLTTPRVDGGLNSRVLQLIPMFHVFGLMLSLGNLARGVTVVVLPRFDFLEMLATIQKFKITAFPLVPPILLMMIKQDVVRKYDMTSLRSIGCGAAPLGKEQLDQCALRFPNAKLIQARACTPSIASAVSRFINFSSIKGHQTPMRSTQGNPLSCKFLIKPKLQSYHLEKQLFH